jgi:hypothetical protein
MMSATNMLKAPCKHTACKPCWQTWITTTLKDNSGGVMRLFCPFCRCDFKDYAEFLEDNEFELGREYYEMMYPDFVRR